MREVLRVLQYPSGQHVRGNLESCEASPENSGNKQWRSKSVTGQEYSMALHQEQPNTNVLGAMAVRRLEREGSKQQYGKWWQSQGSFQCIIPAICLSVDLKNSKLGKKFSL